MFHQYQNKLYLRGELIPDNNVPEVFARFFDTKIREILDVVEIDDDVYNGRRLVESRNKMFMDQSSIRECMLSLKPKNSEGMDRIPQRILLDGMEFLLTPLSRLFE